METPFFMPIATKGALKTVGGLELAQMQESIDSTTNPILLANTYHLYLQPGLDTLHALGGLHRFMNWPHSILTDSGGFQVFSLSSLRSIDNDGVTFRSHRDGSEHRITPEDSMRIQSIIGSDIWMAFDYFPGYPATPEESERSVTRTTEWAQRCKTWSENYKEKNSSHHQLFGIVQGATDEALRKKSAEQLTKIGYDGYAIGGLAVGEPPEEMLRIVNSTTPHLPEHSPRYLMGVGPPEQILEAVKGGIDMFDCVIPTRNARHGSLFVHNSNHPESIVDQQLAAAAYDRINIRGKEWANDDSPLDPHCTCTTCTGGYSKAYIRHLFSIREPLAAHLSTIHNVAFYMQLMKDIRTALDA